MKTLRKQVVQKKNKQQCDVAIESYTVHKFSEKKPIFHPNKQPKLTKITIK